MHVLLADNSDESACGCQALLRRIDRDVTIYRATSLIDTLTSVKDCPRIDLIVWHACEQTEEKFRLVRRLADTVMGIPIVIFAKTTAAAQVAMAIRAGANGYIALPTRRALIVEILRLVLSGGTYFPTSVLADKLQEDETSLAVHQSVQEEARRGLTPRQKDVLELLVEGRTNKEIADSLGIAEATAKQHVSALLRAMQVRTRDEAIQLARPDIALAN
jgi:DNA-binding NarL/FixJ family response regulator